MTGPTVKEWRIVIVMLYACAVWFAYGAWYLVHALDRYKIVASAFDTDHALFASWLSGLLMGCASTVWAIARARDNGIREDLQRAARLAALQEEQPLGGFRRHE